MRARALHWLLIAALAAPMPVQGQDVSQRPKPRPALETPTPALVKPLPRPSVQTASVPIGTKPLPRPASIAPVAPSAAPVQTASAQVSPITETTPRPKARPLMQQAAAATAAPTATGGLASSPFPAPRPKALVEAVAAVNAAPSEPQASDTAANPKPNLIQLLFGAGGSAGKVPKGEAGEELASAAPAPNTSTSTAPRKGSVCGDRSIRGEKIKPITSKVKGCGIAEPVRVTEVAGIKLSQAVTVECGTVVALKDWIDKAMRPAFGRREVVQLRIAAHYACRGRNNKKGARISEHGKGKALDISGFIFADGSEWTIRRDYNKQIRKAHKGACGIFGTTLGPGSDGYHEDHLHFDTARYRSAPYCR